MPLSLPLRRSALVVACSVLAVAGASATGSAATASGTAQGRPGKVDLGRYAGTWYQLAAVPQLFEIQCEKNVRAQYTPNADGTVGVRNTCTTWWGSTSAVDGAALPLDSSGTSLNVSFQPKPGGGYVHTQEANYVIAGLDESYTWAAVTNEDRTSGFLLSRTPTIGKAELAAAVQSFTEASVDPCALRPTRQDGDAQDPTQLC
ncbi:lipocalin family protein [Streptomyces sp. CS7]|uniref:lipocalin family protein n=1 Tax=Streptomyces sp. CS-7 TaxID=2906769 RepID=UPI0021B36E85|nr:lipocalin family protein [Streptomyces sp. CS-7]MCT6782292.1 lipocalin family protein [Streptomyces sp. CS-7]